VNVVTLPTTPIDIAEYYALFGFTGSSIFPSASYSDDSRTSDNKSLRRWIQYQVFHVFINNYSLLPVIEMALLYSSYCNDQATCIKNKLDEVNTRFGAGTLTDNWTTHINYISNFYAFLPGYYTDVKNLYMSAVTSNNPFTSLSNIISKFNSVRSDEKHIIDNLLQLLKDTINKFKTTILNKLISETNKYIIEAYGINDDDLNAIANTGSAGAQQNVGTIGVAELYRLIRQNKTDTDEISLSDALSDSIDYYISGTKPTLITPPQGIWSTQDPAFRYYSDVMSNLTDPKDRITKPMLELVENLYLKYEDSYQKLQIIKKVTVGEIYDIPRIEDSLIQAALASIQDKLSETVIEVSRGPGQPDTITTAQIQTGLAKAVDVLTFSYNDIISTDAISLDQIQFPFQNIIDILSFKLCTPTVEYYNSSGTCTSCTVCPVAPTNATLTATTCTQTTDTTCSYACMSGFTTSSSGANTTCTCPVGSYIKADGTCEVCSTCTDTISTRYTASGCDTTNTTINRTCARSCQPGYYDNNGTCTLCATCAAAPANGTVTSTSCTPTADTVCTYACKSGFTTSSSGANTTCTCPVGSYIKADGTCAACSTCAPDTTNIKYTASGCDTNNTTINRTCTSSCQTGYYDNNGTCTLCTACAAAPANGTVQTTGCTDSTNRSCTYSCNIGFYSQIANGVTSCNSCGWGSSTLTTGKTSYYDCFEVADYRCPQYFSATAGYETASYYDCAYSATSQRYCVVRNGIVTNNCTNYYTCPNGGTLFNVPNWGNYCGTSKQYSCSYTPGYTIKIADDSRPLCWTDCGYNQYKDPVTGTCKTCATCTETNSVSSIYPTTAVGCGGTSPGSCEPTSCRNGYRLFDSTPTTPKKCTCSFGYYIRSSDGYCVPCSSCPANTTSTVYTTTGGCDGFHTDVTSDRICTRSCQPGYYDNNGTCTVCSTPTCGAAPTNGTVTTTSCTTTTNATCTYACKSGFTTSGSGAGTTCTCPAGSYIKSDGTCGACSSCPANTTSTVYTAAGCLTINTTNDRTCARSCQPGYYDNNGTCTVCSTCGAAPTNGTVLTAGCIGSTDRTCTYVCNYGFTTSTVYNAISGASTTCTCASGKYIDESGVCTVCLTCSIGYTRTSCGGTSVGICNATNITCPSGGTLRAGDKHYCDSSSSHDYVIFGCTYRCPESGYSPDGWSTQAIYGCTDHKTCRANSIVNCPLGYTADWTNLRCIQNV
jgi:hypothetical protein